MKLKVPRFKRGPGDREYSPAPTLRTSGICSDCLERFRADMKKYGVKI